MWLCRNSVPLILTKAALLFLAVSTTVVNPSLWMPIYQTSRWNSIFFIFFIVTAVFYLHSLVLSVVFQTYIQAASEIHERSASDREDAVRLAFLVLSKDGQRDVITSTNVRETLQLVRPHYNPLKVCRCFDDLRAHHICDDSKTPDHKSLTMRHSCRSKRLWKLWIRPTSKL